MGKKKEKEKEEMKKRKKWQGKGLLWAGQGMQFQIPTESLYSMTERKKIF